MKTHHYGIIGNGRMAKHFAHYLKMLNIPYMQWYRGQSDQRLHQIIERCSPILLLINDDAIVSFIQQHAFLPSNVLIHFSGKLYTPLAHGTHPLLSFFDALYPLETYQKIPFICEEGSPAFKLLLPGLSNPHFTIPIASKSFYHALCVLSGNFTVILWQKFFTELEQTFHIPKQHAYPYLEQIMANLLNDAKNALTGPLIRNDQETIASHLESLTHDPFKSVYQAFLQAFNTINQTKNI